MHVLVFALFYLQKWKDMVGHGRTWRDMVGHGRTWEDMIRNGWSMVETGVYTALNVETWRRVPDPDSDGTCLCRALDMA